MSGIALFVWKLFLRLTNPTCTLRAKALGKDLRMEDHVTIEAGSYVTAKFIGRYTFINKYCLIDKSVESIGRFCSIAYGVKIGLGGHPLDRISTHAFTYDKKYGFVKENTYENFATAPKCIIGNDVWIGANATILAGVTVGDGAVISANAFVNKDVEPYSVVVGTPAKHLKYRFDEATIKQLLEIKWWDWKDEKIRRNIVKFNNLISFLEEHYED